MEPSVSTFTPQRASPGQFEGKKVLENTFLTLADLPVGDIGLVNLKENVLENTFLTLADIHVYL